MKIRGRAGERRALRLWLVAQILPERFSVPAIVAALPSLLEVLHQRRLEKLHVLASGGDVLIAVVLHTCEREQGCLVVAAESLRGAVCSMGPRAKSLERVDAHSQRGFERLAIDMIDALFDEGVCLESPSGTNE